MNSIKKLIKAKENKCMVFKPTSTFYNEIRINRKRWGQIYRGEVSPTVDELKLIAEFFNAELTKLI